MLHLLPYPKEMRMDGGVFCLTRDTRIRLPEEAAPQLDTAADQLQDEVLDAACMLLTIDAGFSGAGNICLTLNPAAEAGYTLDITEAGVCIAAAGTENVLHGAQTLRQIIRQCGKELPCLHITDAPVYAARGFYHDVTRGRVPTLDWLKELADMCCLYKLNQLQLYVEHTYLSRDIPELHAAAGTPLTAEEIRELDEYCAVRGIDLVPSLSTFGHLFELLRTERFAPLCEMEDAADYPSTMPNRMAHHTIDPTNPASLTLVLSMIDEYMALFRSGYFNICADETFDLGKGRNRGREERELYMGFVKKLCAHVVSRGKTPMFWGDIVVKFADALSELPEGTVCLNWGYAADVTGDSTRILASAGARQYVCPGVNGWNRWIPSIRTGYHNIRRMAEYGVKYGAEGLLNTDWGDYGHINDPRLSMPGLVMGACAAWNGLLPEEKELFEAVSRVLYGDSEGRVVSIMADLADGAMYSWWHIVRYKDNAQGLLSDPWGEPRREPVDNDVFAASFEKNCWALEALRYSVLHTDTCFALMNDLWETAAEAVCIWDVAYHLVLLGEKSAEIAQELLTWLDKYESLWREVSKEAELWRIRDVAAWYAEQLM